MEKCGYAGKDDLMSPKQAREMGNRATYYAQAHLDGAVAAVVSVFLADLNGPDPEDQCLIAHAMPMVGGSRHVISGLLAAITR